MEPAQASLAAIIVSSLILGACATTGAQAASKDDFGAVVTQPVHDLGLARREIPPALKAAAAAPYGPTAGGRNCADIRSEIASLDQPLGQDLDQASTRSEGISDLTLAALRGAVSLPFRGVVRRITGAEKRTRALERATLAGIARRGYLKGVAATMGCP